MNQGDAKKRYGLFVLAVAMLLSGGIVLMIGFNDSMIRSLGVLMCVVSAYLVRISNIRGRKGPPTTGSQGLNLAASQGPGRLGWAWGVVSAVALGISFICLYEDALDGYHQIWPVYAFAGSVLICALVWSYLISRLWSGGK